MAISFHLMIHLLNTAGFLSSISGRPMNQATKRKEIHQIWRLFAAFKSSVIRGMRDMLKEAARRVFCSNF